MVGRLLRPTVETVENAAVELRGKIDGRNRTNFPKPWGTFGKIAGWVSDGREAVRLFAERGVFFVYWGGPSRRGGR